MFRCFVRLFIAMTTALFVTSALADTHDEERIKQLALEAILQNPEIITEAIAVLQSRDEERRLSEMKERLSPVRDLLENDPNAPVLGNPNGDVILIEFFDYNCPYCKRVAPDVAALISQNESIRLVYREWPILGDGSVFAARAALAARRQGKYEELHWELMSLRQADRQSVLVAAEAVGLDVSQLEADMFAPEIESHIELSMQLANAIGITGTPTFIIGDQIAPGAISLDQMNRLVEDFRTRDE